MGKKEVKEMYDLNIASAAIEGFTIREKVIERDLKQVVSCKITFLKDEQKAGTLEHLARQMAKGAALNIGIGTVQLDMNTGEIKTGKEGF